jgi:hypothetical protein
MPPSRSPIAFLLLGLLTVVVIVAAVVGITMSSAGIPSALDQAAQATLDAKSFTATVTVQTSQVAIPLSAPGTNQTGAHSSMQRSLYYTAGGGSPQTTELMATGSGSAIAATRQVGSGSTVTSRSLHLPPSAGGGFHPLVRPTVVVVRLVPQAATQLASTVTQYLRAILGAGSAQLTGSTYHLSVPASQVVQPGLSSYAVANGRAQLAATVSGGYVTSLVVNVSYTPASQLQTVKITPNPSLATPPSISVSGAGVGVIVFSTNGSSIRG